MGTGARGQCILLKAEEIMLAQGAGRDALQLHVPLNCRKIEPHRSRQVE
jgi:hypothetical protein